jgi:hypothetical protein
MRFNTALPPRRLVQVAEGLDRQGAHGVVASICQARDPATSDYRADFGPAFDSILLAVENALPPGCIEEQLVRRASGEVNCVVLETLPVGVTCASQADRGRDPIPVRVEGVGPSARETCRVRQLIPTPVDLSMARDASGQGWFYDDYTSHLTSRCPPGRQAVVFAAGAGVTVDADVIMECLGAVPVDPGRADVGTACVTDPSACDVDGIDLASLRAQYRRPDASLLCVTGNCHLSCVTDADCPGLQVCDAVEERTVCQDIECRASS